MRLSKQFSNTTDDPLKVWVIPKAVKTCVAAEGSLCNEIDVVTSLLGDEPLIGDMLAGSLEIAAEDFTKDLLEV